MTEQQWLTCAKPEKMLDFLGEAVGHRKLRLFACACCRSVWHLIGKPVVSRAVEVAERYADWEASDDELADAHRDAAREESAWHYGGDGVQLNTAAAAAATTAVENYEVHWGTGEEDDWYVFTTAATSAAAAACAWSVYFDAMGGCYDEEGLETYRQVIEAGRRYAESDALDADPNNQEDGFDKVVQAEGRRQAALLRDIFGNPFRAVSVDPEWLTSTVVSLARQMYESRDFSTMPILADALQDAGCDNADILDHCRDAHGVHVRGCWVVDLVLGK